MSNVRQRALLAVSIIVMLSANARTLVQNSNTSGVPEARQQEGSTAITKGKLLKEFTVIGSHIRGIKVGGLSPAIISDVIASTGAATLRQFFTRLPQNVGGGQKGASVANLGVDRDRGNNDGQGSTINLSGRFVSMALICRW